MNVNLNCCKKCSNFTVISKISDSVFYMMCYDKKQGRGYLIGYITDHIVKNQQNEIALNKVYPTFKQPECCPYLLEHLISDQEENKKTLDSFHLNYDDLFNIKEKQNKKEQEDPLVFDENNYI